MVKRRQLPLSILLSGALLTPACGVKDLDFTFAGAGSSAEGGTGSGSGGAEGSAGETGEPFTCHAGERRCAGNTPEECSDDGAWLPGKPCAGTNGVCTGAGTCAAYLLVNAGIEGLGVRSKETGLILKRQTLASAKRSCAPSGLCVTGAIR